MDIVFPDLLNLYTLEYGHLIFIYENKYKGNLIFLKNYFKDYNYQFLPLQLQSSTSTIIDTFLVAYLLNLLIFKPKKNGLGYLLLLLSKPIERRFPFFKK